VLNFGMLGEEFLNRRLFNLPFVLPIDLVANQNEREFLWLFWSSLVEKLSDPALDVVKRLTHSQITRLLVMSYTSTQQSAPL
jgi:hypothetical protein